jgi:probable HAF family extracellular repeat protein
MRKKSSLAVLTFGSAFVLIFLLLFPSFDILAQSTRADVLEATGDGASYVATSINDSGTIIFENIANYGSRYWKDGIASENLGFSSDEVSASNIIVGGKHVGSQTHAILYTIPTGALTDIGTLGGSEATARGINDTGEVVGGGFTAQGDHQAFYWYNGVMTNIGAWAGQPASNALSINNQRQATGVVVDSQGKYQAVIYNLHQQSVTYLPTLAGGTAYAEAINDLGQVVGRSTDSDGLEYPVIWENGIIRKLSNYRGYATDINELGEATGFILPANQPQQAVVWSSAATILIDDDPTLLSGQTRPIAINNVGQVAAYHFLYTYSNTTPNTPTPTETSTPMPTATNTPTPTPTYTFSGFFQPIDNPPAQNVMKAGKVVKVRFSLGGDFGRAIFAPGYPTSQAVSCDTSAPIDTVESTIDPAASSLSYDPLSNRYTYIWSTTPSWEGTCRQLAIRLSDNTTHSAIFRFR